MTAAIITGGYICVGADDDEPVETIEVDVEEIMTTDDVEVEVCT